MNDLNNQDVLKNEIYDLKSKLEEMLNVSSMSSNKVIELSKKLDMLILDYYKIEK